ncbi:hypothetical protein ABW21_db0206944 [Orbilia brochopaga]|nr:hypothetical protein ABW21_db0206944 [Drechslerella brochopaga]
MLGDVLFEQVQSDADDEDIHTATVKVSLWNPAAMDKMLGGDWNLLRFAWCLHHDSVRAAKLQATFSSSATGILRERAKMLQNAVIPPAFREQYTLPPNTLYASPGSSPTVILDSRMAEIIYRSRQYKHLTHPRAKEVSVTLYLPVLMEDTTKKSAWNIGLSVRKIAYGLLFDSDSMLSEACRKATGVTHQYVTISTTTDAIERLANEIVAETGGVNPTLVYLVHLIVLEYQHANSPLEKTDMLALLAAVTTSPPMFEMPEVSGDQWTWPRIQLLAQLQAGLWSLYLLQTTLMILDVPGDLGNIVRRRLAGLPRLVQAVDARRMMAVYALTPRLGKKARKRKRVKNERGDDGILNMITRLFRKEDREVAMKLLGMRDDRDGGSDEEEGEGDVERDVGRDGDGDEYMGMTVG